MAFSDFEDAQYRMSSCSECGKKERCNRLHLVRVKEESGYSTSKRTTRTHYRYVRKRLCNSCYASYKRDQDAQKLFILVLGAAIVVVVVLGGKFGGVSGSDRPQPQKATSSISDMPAQSLSRAAPAPEVPTQEQGSPPTPLIETPTGIPPSEGTSPPEEPDVRSIQPSTTAAEIMTVTDLANVRATPNNGQVLGQVWPGEPLVIVEQQGKWAQVSRGRGQIPIGWIYRSLLVPVQ